MSEREEDAMWMKKLNHVRVENLNFCQMKHAFFLDHQAIHIQLSLRRFIASSFPSRNRRRID